MMELDSSLKLMEYRLRAVSQVV